METVESFIKDVINSVSEYFSFEMIVPLLIGLALMSAFWEWAGKNENNDNQDNN